MSRCSAVVTPTSLPPRFGSNRNASAQPRSVNALRSCASNLPAPRPVALELRNAGIECQTRDDERTLLWDKLAFLAPIALTTSALDAPLGDVRANRRFNDCRDEALAIAKAEGATIDDATLIALQQAAPAEMRSSMQKDVAAGREPELDAIAGPIIRGGQHHAIPTPATEELATLVAERANR